MCQARERLLEVTDLKILCIYTSNTIKHQTINIKHPELIIMKINISTNFPRRLSSSAVTVEVLQKYSDQDQVGSSKKNIRWVFVSQVPQSIGESDWYLCVCNVCTCGNVGGDLVTAGMLAK